MPPPAAPLAAARRRLDGWLQCLPSQCGVCRSWPSRPVCQACVARFGQALPRCPGCALPWTCPPQGPARCGACLRQPLPLQACWAAVDYAYPWRGLITALKFHRQTGWTALLAGLLLERAGLRAHLQGLEPADWMLPLPLSHRRLGERGFNQAWELARALHRLGGCQARLDARLLLRLRHTPRQSELDLGQRLANVRGAFAVDPLRRAELAGRRVVLVDDVMTSGASLVAAALALRAAGAREVVGLVVARTP